MSICDSGIKDKTFGKIVPIKVEKDHPFIKLANFIPWQSLYGLVLPDLKSTTAKGQWWRGRKIKVRIHLGV